MTNGLFLLGVDPTLGGSSLALNRSLGLTENLRNSQIAIAAINNPPTATLIPAIPLLLKPLLEVDGWLVDVGVLLGTVPVGRITILMASVPLLEDVVLVVEVAVLVVMKDVVVVRKDVVVAMVVVVVVGTVVGIVVVAVVVVVTIEEVDVTMVTVVVTMPVVVILLLLNPP